MNPDNPGRGETLPSGADRLEREGNALLVVGRVPDDLQRRACRRLVAEAGPRLRLRTDGTRAGRDTASFDRTVDYGLTARSAATAPESGPGPAATGGAAGRSTDDSGADGPRSLAEFGGEFARALDAVTPAAPGAPGVCVGSPLPLVEATDEPTVFRFLHTVAGAVRAAGGRCHVHLPLTRTDERSLTFGAIADGTVELRLAGDQPQQRWHHHEADTRSAWLALG